METQTRVPSAFRGRFEVCLEGLENVLRLLTVLFRCCGEEVGPVVLLVSGQQRRHRRASESLSAALSKLHLSSWQTRPFAGMLILSSWA